MRFVGTFVADPVDVPGGVVEYVAEQLDVAPASMATYTQREKTRLEHQWEIAREVGYRDFVDAEAELAVWVDDRAWTTGEGPVAVFNGAVGWLRERQVLLPGVTTLARLVAREREAATLRVWTELAQPVSGQARLLRGLLVVPEGSRRSELDQLRKAETVTSGAGMVRHCAAYPTSPVWGWAALTSARSRTAESSRWRATAWRPRRRRCVVTPSAAARDARRDGPLAGVQGRRRRAGAV